MPEIKESVETVGEAWVESPYYDQAEQWTWMFWLPETPFRRMFDTLDLDTVIELASGHGRHTERAAVSSRRLIAMDLHQANIDFCKNRLSHCQNVECHVNNGHDYLPVQDDCVTSIFCYDAMVHFSPDLVASYLKELDAGTEAIWPGFVSSLKSAGAA